MSGVNLTRMEGQVPLFTDLRFCMPVRAIPPAEIIIERQHMHLAGSGNGRQRPKHISNNCPLEETVVATK